VTIRLNIGAATMVLVTYALPWTSWAQEFKVGSVVPTGFFRVCANKAAASKLRQLALEHVNQMPVDHASVLPNAWRDR
jgi:hypothetical protein